MERGRKANQTININKIRVQLYMKLSYIRQFILLFFCKNSNQTKIFRGRFNSIIFYYYTTTKENILFAKNVEFNSPISQKHIQKRRKQKKERKKKLICTIEYTYYMVSPSH